jgi:hypothetical protein
MHVRYFREQGDEPWSSLQLPVSRPASVLLPTLARRLLPPLGVFLLAQARLWRSARTAGAHPWVANAWARWDSGHYLSIAQRGYEFFSCARVPGYGPNAFCGNTAWLPAYPLLIRALTLLHVRPEVAGVLIAGAATVAMLTLLWNGFLDAELSPAAILTLLLAGLFPGHVYQYAVFPVSLCICLHVAALHAYMERRFVWAGIFGACSAFIYSSGVFIAAVFGLHALMTERRKPFRDQLRVLLATSGITALGLIAFLLMLQIQVGTWQAYFLVQKKYAYQATWPWIAIIDHVHTMQRSTQDTQTVFVAVLATLLLIGAARAPRRAIDGALALFVLAYWWVPLALGGSLSLYRSEAVIVSAVPLARKLPVPILIVLLILAFILAAKMDVLFFRNVLV